MDSGSVRISPNKVPGVARPLGIYERGYDVTDIQALYRMSFVVGYLLLTKKPLKDITLIS